MGRPRHKTLGALTLFLTILSFAFHPIDTISPQNVSAEGVPDTAVRGSLLERKKVKELSASLVSSRSIRYPSIIRDLDVTGEFGPVLPWASLVPKDPSGRYSFSWRIRLGYGGMLRVQAPASNGADFSFKVFDYEGLPVYLQTPSMTLPNEETPVKAGLYVIRVSSTVPLSSFEVSLKPSGDAPPSSSQGSQPTPPSPCS